MLSRKCSSGKPSHNIGAFFNTIGHVWTAPWQELSDVLVGCGHVSGLLMRAVETAGSDGVREQGPILLFRLRRRSEKMAIMTQMATVDQLLRKTLAVLDD